MANVDADAERLRYDRSSADRNVVWKVSPALTPHMSHGKDHDAFALAVRPVRQGMQNLALVLAL